MRVNRIFAGKIIIVLMVLFSCTCLPFSYTASASSTVVDAQIKRLKGKNLPGGYEPVAIFSSRILGTSTPQVLASYSKFNSSDFTFNNLLIVHNYDANKKSWKTISTLRFSNQDYVLGKYAAGKLMDNNKDQVVMGVAAGSGAYLTPYLIGSTDGKTVKVLLTSDEAPIGGSALIKDKQLYLLSGTIVTNKYSYKSGKFFKYKGSGADDRKVAQGAKYLLTLEKKNGKTVLGGNRNIVMKVGEKLSVVRKNAKDAQHYGYRILSTVENSPLDYGTIFTAKKPGKEVWAFEPDAYDTSVKVTITVKK